MNRRKIRPYIIALAALWLIAITAGCASGTDSGKGAAPSAEVGESAAGTKLEKIRYAPLSGVSGLAVSFGAEKGFFEEEGLDVEFITTKDPIAGLTSKDIDVVDVATTTAIVAAGKGAPVKIVSSMFRTKGPFYLIASPEIKTVEDLKGKKVGIAVFGSGLEVYTRVILKEHGLKPEDVTFIANSTHQAAYASLETGQVDATIIHEPFASLAEKQGKGNIIATGWDYLPTFHTGVLAARDGILNEKPELVEKLLRAYFKSQEYAKSHPDEYKAYYLNHIEIDPEVLELALEREEVLWENNPDVDISALNDTQQIQKELGFQDEIYKVEDILDLRFIPKK
ncbi:ABC transporter substrate-binding protein [Paenibacillus lautus]|uniref:ABC transporter substrate-binding protein n=1 Tax=Paenibacillus lautus TaxID=1401 RepID=UPI001C7DB9E5|nr:ABC transporter substrate-binding protein [Paenibacillus lautus]MBX4146619.1 ABC transporter substrate-binding protein [Paenibacillus lautus]